MPPMNVSDDLLMQLFKDVEAIKQTTEHTQKTIERLGKELEDVKTFKTSVVVKLAAWFVASMTAMMSVTVAGVIALGSWVLPRLAAAVADMGGAVPMT